MDLYNNGNFNSAPFENLAMWAMFKKRKPRGEHSGVERTGWSMDPDGDTENSGAKDER